MIVAFDLVSYLAAAIPTAALIGVAVYLIGKEDS
jgi:hypothetical protein